MRIFVKVKEGDKVHLTVPPQSGVVNSVYFVGHLVNNPFGTWSPYGPVSQVRMCQTISLSLWMYPVGADKVCAIL